MAVGAAMTGLRPIIEGMNMGFCSSPSTKSQITLACYAISGGNFKTPMVIRGPGVLVVS
jgi:pyruvate dehydrogenase E1 component beta subunit